MKVLLDQEVSHRLRHPLQEALNGVPVESVLFHKWEALRDEALRDDELLDRARSDGFRVLLTTDKNLACEQAPLSIAVITLDDNRRRVLLLAVDRISSVIKETQLGEDRVIAISM